MRLRMLIVCVGVAVASVVVTSSVCLAAIMGPLASHDAAASLPSRSVVLVTSITETDQSVSAGGASTQIGNIVVGGGAASENTYLHSEVWETVRRFESECPAATFVTNPQTPHTFTVHVDYQEIPSLFGKITLYQLALLNAHGNPVYITKKNYLRREIKPVCRAIMRAE